MEPQKQIPFYTEEAYLEHEQKSTIRHEYIDGYLYAMVGTSERHNRIASTISGEFFVHLKGKPCDVYTSDFKVKIGSRYYYPDVIVKCDHPDDPELYTERPLLILEIISQSTRRIDTGEKRLAYQTIPSLREYVIIEQHQALITAYRRKGDQWQTDHYRLGDVIHFYAIDLQLMVETIYERIDNEDMRKFLQGRM
ncbi:Uma2 family endonuclease [Magnetococcales bacterium HHB-1]